MYSAAQPGYHSRNDGSASAQAWLGTVVGLDTFARRGDVSMDTYILLAVGFGLALAIAVWGIWKLR
jgi:hypothetical protein